MPALSFQPRFVQPILDGVKDQTIRAPRKVPIRPGQTLHLFMGMRTKHCRRIATVMCIAVLPVTIRPFLYGGGVDLAGWGEDGMDLELFARRDGFGSWAEMCDFWQDTHGALAFTGNVYRWEPLIPFPDRDPPPAELSDEDLQRGTLPAWFRERPLGEERG